MHQLRRAAACALIAIAGSCLAATTASAGQPQSSVVLVLRPTSEAALHALAVAGHLSPAQRARRAHALIPDARRHRTIATVARALGLTVDRTAAWSMRVHGAAPTVTSLFGTLRAHHPQAAGRAYPLVPAALDAYVVAALPTSGRVARPLRTAAPRDGNDFRAAYSAPPNSTGAGLAIASVQLSGWKSADLATYAQHHHINSFDLATQYVARPVAGAHSDTPDGMGGDEEVALDQEAILATAPGATQVAYFAPNDDGGDGYIAAIRAVGDEAATYHTVALTLSWGGCEASDDRKWLAAMDSALEYATAAGHVTAFGASGDAGSQDCVGEIPGSAQFLPAVDYPASSPYVVAVGGVSLPGSGNSNQPTGWSGSGGGESSFEPLPSWQFGVAGHSPNNRRLVPDIASDADPDNGLCVYQSTTPETTSAGCPSGEFMLGGTSLGAPTQAALLADTLAASGWQTGVGDIHSALYAGAAAGAITDVTADEIPGSGNGDYESGPGYDLVTGLGTPVWTSVQTWLGQFDAGAPRATRTTTFAIKPHAPLGYAPGYQNWAQPVVGGPTDCSVTSVDPPTTVTLPADAVDGLYTFALAGTANTAASGASPACHTGSATVVLDRHAPKVSVSLTVSAAGLASGHWSFSDSAPSSGLQKFVVTATAAGRTQWTWTTTNRSRTFGILAHPGWNLRVTAYDNAGNVATAVAHLYDDNHAFSFGSRWTRLKSPAAYRRSFVHTGRAGAATRATVSGTKFVLYVRTCPNCGKAAVYDGQGRRLLVIDTYSARTRYRVPVTLLSLSTPAKRTFVVKVLSSKNRRSKGRDIGIDAFACA